MFTVYFHAATTTPFQPGLRQLVEAALSERRAEWTGLTAELRLADGAMFYLFGHDDEEGMLFEYPVLTDEVVAVVLAILSWTHGFALGLSGDLNLVQATGGVGEPRGALINNPDVLQVDHEGLHGLLVELESNVSDPSTSLLRPAQSKQNLQPRSVSSGLMDFMFGKKV